MIRVCETLSEIALLGFRWVNILRTKFVLKWFAIYVIWIESSVLITFYKNELWKATGDTVSQKISTNYFSPTFSCQLTAAGIKKDSRSKIAIISKLLAAIISRFKRKSSSFKNHKHCDHVYKKKSTEMRSITFSVRHCYCWLLYLWQYFFLYRAIDLSVYHYCNNMTQISNFFFFAKAVLARTKAEFAI